MGGWRGRSSGQGPGPPGARTGPAGSRGSPPSASVAAVVAEPWQGCYVAAVVVDVAGDGGVVVGGCGVAVAAAVGHNSPLVSAAQLHCSCTPAQETPRLMRAPAGRAAGDLVSWPPLLTGVGRRG